ncbi:MAG TPA: flavin reductase family protein [Gaiellaceae bacterium]|jgi:flavin reductase (DIM6/NTAB) family NADH-FMN oxidoreductase RutF
MKWADDLITAFEAGRIDGSAFRHGDHISVAWGLAQRYPADTALERLTDGIRAMAERAGRPGVYHVTITRAWFELIAGVDDLAKHPELFDRSLLERYYSPERLAAGRTRWVEPDLHPLRLPPPPRGPERRQFGEALRRIPTGVALVAACHGQEVRASTVSSFTSVSREPALVSVCLANQSRTLELIRNAEAFALSLLAADQASIAVCFANGDRPEGAAQFADVPHQLGPFGPVLEASAASIGCRVHAVHSCGDHHIVIGDVQQATTSERRPLVRHDGEYHEDLRSPAQATVRAASTSKTSG